MEKPVKFASCLLKQGQAVEIVNCGEVSGITGTICGYYGDMMPVHMFYIIKLDNPKQFRPDYEYDTIVLTNACILALTPDVLAKRKAKAKEDVKHYSLGRYN